jgi:(p)ppGpp synthase/HD superfamily hydrolase
MQLTSRFDGALVYASDKHRLQRRKSTEVPYVGHLLGVASIVIDNGGDEDEAIAALLHDCPEDQGGAPRLDDIRVHFGDRVANIVEACSDSLTENPDEKPPWRKRKEDYLAHLRATSDPSVYLVSAADKLHNLRSMTSDFSVVGHDLWSRFNKDAGMTGVLWYYRSLVSIYDTIDDPRVSRVAAQLKATFRRLEIASAANGAQQLKTGVL